MLAPQNPVTKEGEAYLRSRNDFLHSGQSVSFPDPLPLLLGALRGMSPGTGYISSNSNGSPLGEPWLRDELCEVTLNLRLGYGAALNCPPSGDNLPLLRFPNSGDEGFEVGGGECALCQLGEPRDEAAEHGSSNCCDGEGIINEGSISAANLSVSLLADQKPVFKSHIPVPA